jgi:tetratricopeptide (TPR) repeat protein
MPLVQPEKRKIGKRVAVIGAASVVALVLLVVGVLWVATPTAAAAVAQSDKLNEAGSYSQALELLKRSQWKAWSKEDKILLVSRMASTATNQNDLRGALAYYQQLEELQNGVTFANAMNRAELAERLGDKQLAVEQYRQALEELKKLPKGDVPVVDSEYIEARIQELQQ